MGSEITLSSATMTAILGLLIVFIGILLYKVFQDKDNDLSCWQFIATYNYKTGKHNADLDKLGKCVGIFGSTWAVIKIAYIVESRDIGGFAALLGTWLAFVGGIAGWAAYLRTKEGNKIGSSHTETTSTTRIDNQPLQP